MPNILSIDIVFQIFFTSRPQVGWLMANTTKVEQKDAQNSKRMWLVIQLLWGGQQCRTKTLYVHCSY